MKMWSTSIIKEIILKTTIKCHYKTVATAHLFSNTMMIKYWQGYRAIEAFIFLVGM